MSKILVVVDMQNDFVDGSLGTKEAAAIVPKVLSKIKSHNGIVVYTRDTHQPEYLSTQEGKYLPVLHCVENTIGWQIVAEIQALADKGESRIFNKDTFGSKDLIEYLIELNEKDRIDEIQLVGLCTDICIISNALAVKAYFPEVPIIVDEACCAGVTPESHENAINAMKVCQIEILNP
ncbi:MAG TPA: amidase [Clostridiales bacterium]|nr:cysteine hydrolase [Clostridia bacterium]MDD4681126.1 cysteine hydrolase [Clostridia bacterium]HCS74168.1 amidase [Clostridiales bacterium]